MTRPSRNVKTSYMTVEDYVEDQKLSENRRTIEQQGNAGSEREQTEAERQVKGQGASYLTGTPDGQKSSSWPAAQELKGKKRLSRRRPKLADKGRERREKISVGPLRQRGSKTL